jgi:hypothetical protein
VFTQFKSFLKVCLPFAPQWAGFRNGDPLAMLLQSTKSTNHRFFSPKQNSGNHATTQFFEK